MEKRMTKKDYLGVLRGLAEQAGEVDAVAFCDKEIERLANRKSTETKTQKENKVLAVMVFKALKAQGKAMTVSELMKADEKVGAYSNQKISALMRMLIKAGTVVKVTEKKVSYFSVVEGAEMDEVEVEDAE